MWTDCKTKNFDFILLGNLKLLKDTCTTKTLQKTYANLVKALFCFLLSDAVCKDAYNTLNRYYIITILFLNFGSR